ncbi:MAG: TAXI family TRAP transporter solute-binding subunit [Planctomycetaceae bacterium]|nr:TAXI family TRAP transporter solute-binding subunit [Planctomycetaceae bacterium]
MSSLTTARLRTWVTVAMVLVLVGSLALWSFHRDLLPHTIRIATGERSGLYYKIGDAIQGPVEHQTRRSVTLSETRGSDENYQQLVNGEVDLAIVQGGAAPLEDLSVVTPLFREYVFVIVRRESGISSVWELTGRKVLLGQRGSGSRVAAVKVLHHFGIDVADLHADNARSLRVLETDETVDAAIVTAGIEHPQLKKILASNEFDLLPIESAPAMGMVHPFLRKVEVPRGLFAEHPSMPPVPIPTIATTAYLVCQNNAPAELVDAALRSIHEENLRLKVPTLIERQDASQWTPTRMHPIAQRYFNPADNFGMMANVMESLAATKELLFALGAGIYLIWIRWRRMEERELQEIMEHQKEHLDRFLNQTLQIERAQIKSDDVEELQGYMAAVTEIKLKALQELTEEELRGDQAFSIFLDQCSNLIGKIQMKMLGLTSGNLSKNEVAKKSPRSDPPTQLRKSDRPADRADG